MHQHQYTNINRLTSISIEYTAQWHQYTNRYSCLPHLPCIKLINTCKVEKHWECMRQVYNCLDKTLVFLCVWGYGALRWCV